MHLRCDGNRTLADGNPLDMEGIKPLSDLGVCHEHLVNVAIRFPDGELALFLLLFLLLFVRGRDGRGAVHGPEMMSGSQLFQLLL